MKPLLSASLLVACISLFACSPTPSVVPPVALQGMAFYSMPWSVKVARLPANMTQARLQQDLQSVLDDTNRVLSTYQRDTELMRFNRAPAGEWVVVSASLFKAVSTALQVSAQSGGAYDITVAPLVNLWGFGPEGRRDKVPSAAEIAQAKALLGWQAIERDASRSALRKRRPVQLDLSSVGEGVGVDRLAERLEALGLRDYMVAVAGSIRVQGSKADGEPWVVAVEAADGSGRPEQILNLQNQSISTSGSYRNYFEREGRRYSHTIDPRTGEPITHHGVSVTVVSPEARNNSLADAWATALNVLGPEQGLALAQREKLAVFYIEQGDKGPVRRFNSAFQALMGQEKPE